MTDFDKDEWIKRALKARFIVAKDNGDVFRLLSVEENGKIRRYVKVKVSTHAKSGRKYFNLTYENVTKSVLVNRVVALALIPNPRNLKEVNHINGDKGDNSVSNLEWADRSYQEKHARQNNLKSSRGSSNANAKLSPENVIFIKNNRKMSSTDLAKLYNVSSGAIEDIWNGKTWTHI